jgi:hypothetical protein
MSPSTDQSELARRVGGACKPQNIQHLLDPDKNAKSSKYTPQIAAALKCDALWLADGSGTPPHDCVENQGEKLTTQKKASEVPNYTDSPVLIEGVKNAQEQLDGFIAELKEAFSGGRLTPRRLMLLQELLRDGTERSRPDLDLDLRPKGFQSIPTRGGGSGRASGARRKTGTK